MVAEGGKGENSLPFSLTTPKRGGGGGVGGVSRLRFPHEAAVSADTHAFARLPPGGLRKIVFQAPGGPGPKPWGLDPATLALTSCKPSF